jgi:hypothetical protein
LAIPSGVSEAGEAFREFVREQVRGIIVGAKPATI